MVALRVRPPRQELAQVHLFKSVFHRQFFKYGFQFFRTNSLRAAKLNGLSIKLRFEREKIDLASLLNVGLTVVTECVFHYSD